MTGEGSLVGGGRVEWPAGHCCSRNQGPAILKPFGGAQVVERPAGEGSVGRAAPQAEAAAAGADPDIADYPRFPQAGLVVGIGGLAFVGTAAVAAVVVLAMVAHGVASATVVDVVPCRPVQEPPESPV